MCLPLNRSIGGGLVGVAAGLTLDAAGHLADLATDPVESVHRARVALKRARSALRLLEKAGADWALAPRYRLAQWGVQMSSARESAVVAALARKLARRLEGAERDVALLLARRAGPRRPRDPEPIRPALLQEAQALVGAPAPAVSPDRLRALLRESLERADRRYWAAAMTPTPEAIHEWRKAVIVLRDQLAMAARRWPLAAGAGHPLLVRFARQLGRGGDLALLGRRLQRLRVPAAAEPARQALLDRLEADREARTVLALQRWLRLDRRLVRLLGEG